MCRPVWPRGLSIVERERCDLKKALHSIPPARRLACCDFFFCTFVTLNHNHDAVVASTGVRSPTFARRCQAASDTKFTKLDLRNVSRAVFDRTARTPPSAPLRAPKTIHQWR